MAITLHHSPLSRAASVVWMLEEVGQPYTLANVDLRAGEHRKDAHLALNRMGKLPVLVDDGVVISETAAIGVYLADRYALGRLAPQLDDPQRGPYLRWCFFGPSVVEIACMAKGAGWEYRASNAGFGTYDDMVATLEDGLGDGPWLLGERFTMADIILGGTVRWMLRFKMIDARPGLTAWAARLAERPAQVRAEQKNMAIAKEQGFLS